MNVFFACKCFLLLISKAVLCLHKVFHLYFSVDSLAVFGVLWFALVPNSLIYISAGIVWTDPWDRWGDG